MPKLLREIPSDEPHFPDYKLRDDESGIMTLLEELFAWAQPLKKIGFSIDAKEATDELATQLNALVI